ncbi:MAG: tetratricopeptide repeat protein [bacterium]
MTIKAKEIRLTIDQHKNMIRLQDRGITLAESPLNHEILTWKDMPTLQALFRGPGQTIKRISPEDLSALGTRLYQGFFPGEIHEAFTEILRKANQSRTRIDLHLETDSSHLISLPLELIHHPEEGYLLLNDCFSFSRHPLLGMEPGDASGPPLKILMFVSSPADAPPILDFEKEQDNIIWALDPYISKGEAIVDMPDEGTIDTLKEYLDRGGYQVLHFSGHGLFDHKEGEGCLLFENDRGQKEEIPAKHLAKVLKNYPSLRLVFLSGCQTARIDYDIFAGVSQQLLKNGIPMAIGMQHSVSDEGATAFASSFYGELLKAHSAGWALASARTALWERNKSSFEWATPALYGGGWIGEVVDLAKEPQAPLEPRGKPRAFYAGVSYLEQGFVGRRLDLRTLRGKIREGQTGIAICGLGGIGKSTLATRLLERLHWEEGMDILVFQKEVSPEQVVSSLGDTLGGECSRIGKSPDLPWGKKLTVLYNTWPQKKIALLFDNFEDNQHHNGSIKDPEVRKMLTALAAIDRKKLLLILTTRYGPDTLYRHNLGDMGFTGSIKKMYRYPVLRELDLSTKKEIYNRLGGQPRSLELLAGLLRTTEKTWDAVKHRVSQAEEEARQDLMLDILWEELSHKERELLKRIWVYRLPVDEDALTLQAQERSVDNHIASLADRSLIHTRKDEEDVLRYFIHRLTAGYVKDRVTDEETRDAHRIAAHYYEYRIRNQEKDIEILLEARYHHLGAGNLERAAEIAFSAESPLRIWGHIERARQLNQETLERAPDERTRAIALHNLGIIGQGQGEYDKALSMYMEARKIFERIGDVAGISNSYHNIGNIYYLRGEYDMALSMFEESRKIFERIGDVAGVSASLHQIGMIYQKRGEYDMALSMFEEARKIAERIGDVAGVSASLHQIGMIYQKRGDYDMALSMFEESRKIFERIGDVAGVSESYLQIGRIYQDRGDYDMALSMFEESRKIKERIGDVAGVSASLHQIGRIYQDRGDYDMALSMFEEARKIDERIGDVAGVSASLHQIGMICQHRGDYDMALSMFEESRKIDERIGDVAGVSGSLHQIGIIYQDRGDYDMALSMFEESRKIFERIGDVASLASSYAQSGLLHEAKGQNEAACESVLKAFIIFKRIGSPYAQQAGEILNRLRQKIGEIKFGTIWKKLTGEEIR